MRILKRLVVATAVVLAGAASSASAATIDLTGGSLSLPGTSNGGIFEWTDFQTTGSGVIDPFLRLGPDSGGLSAGYNTDGTVEFQTKDDGFTSSLNISVVPIVDRLGTDYYQFLLDINEEGEADKSLLSLDVLEFYLLGQPDLTGYPTFGVGAAPIYTLGAGDWIKMDAALNSGSGKGDVFIFIPTSLFAGNTNEWVYLYAKFGVNNIAGDGFEEISVFCPDTIDNPNCVSGGSDDVIPVPEPGSLMLLGSGLVFAANRFRQRKKN